MKDVMAEHDNHWFHKEYPKTCAPDDFWGQIKRTVNGKAVSQDQIDMILEAVRDGLQFEGSDVLLDLGCGNGALSRHFFPNCSGMLGVDFSSYLIRVARNHFEKLPLYEFLDGDIVSYVGRETSPQRFTKVLCYGVFPYLSHADARVLLKTLHDRFVNLKLIFIGNLPDREKIRSFYPPEINCEALVDDCTSPIGIWRNEEEVRGLAEETGWVADLRCMPEKFYASHYRFDVVLKRTSLP